MFTFIQIEQWDRHYIALLEGSICGYADVVMDIQRRIDACYNEVVLNSYNNIIFVMCHQYGSNSRQLSFVTENVTVE